MHGGNDESQICEVCGAVRFGDRPKTDRCGRCWAIYFDQTGYKPAERRDLVVMLRQQSALIGKLEADIRKLRDAVASMKSSSRGRGRPRKDAAKT